MYIERPKKRHKEKIYNSILLRESYRENGKVKKRTLLNITNWAPEKIQALEFAIKNGLAGNSKSGKYSLKDIELNSGKAAGSLIVLNEIAKQLGLQKVFGKNKKALLTLVMIFGRIMCQGSRRALTYWQDGQALEAILGSSLFNTNELYETLDWIADNKEDFEKELYKSRYKEKPIQLCLYDVTSSYLEGNNNELADFGYNRDKKKGKKQIVIGMLTDEKGHPIGVEVFRGNTSDIETVPEQIKKLADKFGITDIIFVGDRAMVKKTTKEYLSDKEWNFISAITKPQIEALVNKGVIQLELFEDNLIEVESEGTRYILRRNPERAKYIAKNRGAKMAVIGELIAEKNSYLQKHPKAKAEVAIRCIQEKINKLKLNKVYSIITEKNREITVKKEESELENLAKYDGCYVITTDLAKSKISTKQAHQRYKDLALVEMCFKMSKTGMLEIRPLYVRKANRTKALAFISMCAYMILREFWQRVKDVGVPLVHILDRLEQVQLSEIKVKNTVIPMLPSILAKDQELYLKALKISFSKKIL